MVSKNAIDVHIIQGRDLVPRDKEFGVIGKKTSSDPYVKVRWEGEHKGQTRTIMRNLSPYWNETVSIEVDKGRFRSKYSQLPPLELIVYDKDKGSDDDGMGIVKVPITAKSDANPKSQWFDVETGDASADWYCKKACGQIEVMVTTPANKEAATKIVREKEQKKLDSLKRVRDAKEEKKKSENRRKNES